MPTMHDGAHSVQASANKIRDILSEEPQANPAQEVEAAQGLSPEPAAEQQAEPAPEAEGLETPTSEPEAPQLYDVKYGDETKQLSLEELINGNMMERDYRHKTGKLSAREKAIAANEAKLNQTLSDLEMALQSDVEDLESPAMLELREVDPNSYWQAFEKVKIRADKFNQAREAKALAEQEKRQETLGRERELMIQAIPEWLDSNKMQTQWSDLSVYLSSQNQDINQISTHQGIVNARKAMLYDRVMAQDIEQNKTATPAKSTPPAATDAAEITSAEQKRRDRLSKTGRVRDAQAVISDILSR
jgi:hypothetical protein